jgi:hypothetical protein
VSATYEDILMAWSAVAARDDLFKVDEDPSP